MLSAVLLVSGCGSEVVETSVKQPVANLTASAGVAVVETQAGKIRGFVRDGIETFRGIPYAQAERFMPPQRMQPWSDTRLTLTYGNICPQPEISLREPQAFISDLRAWPASENCQNLNVWTPKLDNKKRPVMVWLHGGGFFSGSSMELPIYDGTNLANTGDVVVVSVNHRLNVLGFLDLSAYGDEFRNSGNAGMLDIVAALQWVNENIQQFGGDPDNVTIFGQSGGGAKVTTLMSSPAAEGLFQKAVIQSGAPGSVGRPSAQRKTAQRVAELTFNYAGLEDGDVAALQKIDYADLLSAADQALRKVSQELNLNAGPFGAGISWSPVVDGDFLPAQPFAEKAPEFSKGIPLLIGSTLAEFMLANPRLAERQQWTRENVLTFLNEVYGGNGSSVLAALEKAYPDLAPHDLLTVDTNFRSAVIRTAKLKAEQGDPVYSYLFALRSPLLDYAWAAGHSSELAFVFANPGLGIQSNGGGKVVYDLAEQVSQSWIHFARTGNPNHAGLPEWPVTTPEHSVTMVFDETSEVRVDHDRELFKLLKPE